MMQKITHPTTLRPVQIARLLEQQGSPLAPLAEEIYDLAIAYRIDAAFALAQWMVESQFGRLPLAQVNRNAGMVRVALTRMAAPTGPLHPAGETEPILPPRFGDAYGSGYVSYPSWLAGLEEYFRLLRYVFVDAWREEEVQQIAQAYLATMPGRKPVPASAASPARRRGGSKRRARQRPAATPGQRQPQQPPVSQQEIDAYARRVERYRAEFQAA
jgi:hypothetical protein